jgi:hypothetical protein
MESLSNRQIKRQIKILRKEEYKRLSKPKKEIPKLITEYNNNNHVNGCGIVLLKNINSEWHILLRLINDIYYFPKGHQKIGETIQEGAIRELERYTKIGMDKYIIVPNETIIIDYEPYYHDRGWKYGGHYVYKHMHFFFAIAYRDTKPISNNEYGSYHWIMLDDIGKKKYEQNLIAVFKYIKDNFAIICSNNWVT